MRLVMMGTGLFAEPTFEAILKSAHEVVGLVTQPDHTMGHKRSSTRQTGTGMKTIAEREGVPVLQPESINTPEATAPLREWNADLLVVAAYGQILAREVLEATRLGGINVHASLLPKYRGAAPIAWAIYHGEKTTGVSIIRMSTTLDAGNVLLQEETPIGPEETTGEVEARLAILGADMTLRAIDQLAGGAIAGVKQDPAQVTRAPKMKKEHGLIHWERTAEEVCNQVRAMQPWPTAYSFFHHADKPPARWIIYRATPHSSQSDEQAAPGHLIPSAEDKLLVACGSGSAIEIHEVQPAGRKRMQAIDFLRGHRVQVGDRLGPES